MYIHIYIILSVHVYVHVFTTCHKNIQFFGLRFSANLQRIRSVAAEMKRLPQSKQMARCNLRQCQALRILVAACRLMLFTVCQKMLIIL